MPIDVALIRSIRKLFRPPSEDRERREVASPADAEEWEGLYMTD